MAPHTGRAPAKAAESAVNCFRKFRLVVANPESNKRFFMVVKLLQFFILPASRVQF
jgi:hypothetical protein